VKKSNKILVLIVLSLSPLLFSSTIPYLVSSRIPLNEIQLEQSTASYVPIRYVVSLQQGEDYTINAFMIVSLPNSELTVKISDTPYSIFGYLVNSGSNSSAVMHFTASRTGEYYIQVTGSSVFNIRIYTGIINTQTSDTIEFFDVSYLLVLILPTLIFLLIGVILNKNWNYFKNKLKFEIPIKERLHTIFKNIFQNQQNSSENIISVEEVAGTNEIIRQSSSENVLFIDEVEERLSIEELKEIRQTEEEVNVEEQRFVCIIHKEAIEGANLYLCPKCHTLYCVKCATVLKEKGEKCWSCNSEINI